MFTICSSDSTRRSDGELLACYTHDSENSEKNQSFNVIIACFRLHLKHYSPSPRCALDKKW